MHVKMSRAVVIGGTDFISSHLVDRLLSEGLVTEDEKLRKAASRFVKTIAYTRLENRLSQKTAQPKS